MTNNKTIPIVTIDGPSGSGKGTVSRQLARELGFHFLDSGALYRLLALAASRRGLALDDEPALAALAIELDIDFPTDASIEQVLLEGDDVSDEIRTESAGGKASRVAVLPEVRTALLKTQHAFAKLPGLVADGRDMGTVIFPQAQAKLFLTASAEERAKRRSKQLNEKGISVDYEGILAEIKARDSRDSQRSVAPLIAADDAKIMDTTGVAIDSVVAEARQFIKNQLNQ
ncbi:MAG: (d)CMP kinase [Gammaproteobacteria bacterium]